MDDIAGEIAEIMAKVAARKPLIHHITNFVVMNETANLTLCAGGLPVMAHAPEEVEEMVEAAQALVLNMGTPSREQLHAMLLAGKRANARGIPVIFDPVGAGATQFRTDAAFRILGEIAVSIVRGNAAEVAKLAGIEANISGVESLGVSTDPVHIATAFARKHHCAAAVTGPVDSVTDGERLFRISNGHPMMSTITGTGCMSTTVVATYASVEKDAAKAAAAALAAFGLAGELAAQDCACPGTFHVRLYDALAGLTPERLRADARIEVTQCAR